MDSWYDATTIYGLTSDWSVSTSFAMGTTPSLSASACIFVLMESFDSSACAELTSVVLEETAAESSPAVDAAGVEGLELYWSVV